MSPTMMVSFVVSSGREVGVGESRCSRNNTMCDRGRWRRTQRGQIRCTGADGESEEAALMREVFQRALREPELLDSVGLRDADAATLDEITRLGEAEMGRILAEMRADAALEAQAGLDQLGDSSSKELLARFDAQRDQIMAKVFQERQVIQDEAERIQSLAADIDIGKQRKSDEPRSHQLLRLLSFTFLVSSVLALWEGISRNDVSGGIQNATLNAVAGAVATFVLRRNELHKS